MVKDYEIFSDGIFVVEVTVNITFEDASFSHSFGVEKDTAVKGFDVLQAWMWVGDHETPIAIPTEEIKKDRQYMAEILDQIYEDMGNGAFEL